MPAAPASQSSCAATAPGRRSHLSRAFLRAAKLGKRDIKVDLKVDLGGGPGLERLIAGGTVVACSPTLRLPALPVAADVLKVEVRDLAATAGPASSPSCASGTAAAAGHRRRVALGRRLRPGAFAFRVIKRREAAA
jgi:hypothetical protein